MAEMSLVIRDYDKTLYYIDRALKVDELESKAYLLRGVVMIENGDTVRGIKNFMKAIDVNQDYFEANLQLGILYAAKKNELAIDYFNNAINISPGNIDVMYYLAMFYQETGRFEKAIQEYNVILENDPEFYISFYNIGYINLVHFNDYESAIEYFTKAIDIKPDYAEAYYNRGFAYELLQDVENSQKDYRKTLELHANYEKAIEGLNRIDDYLLGKREE
jgi:tetratricopeptide (TPR) repeat protein